MTELLDFARPREPKFRDLDLAASVDDVVKLARSSLTASNVEIETQVPSDVPLVQGDAEQIKQVLLNLTMNAIQATGDSGVVTVGARRDGRHVMLIVADDGPGVPEEMRSRIFDPFFTTRDSGTGLGLAVVQQIVTQHGGRIDVETNGSRGARFVGSIPIRRGSEE